MEKPPRHQCLIYEGAPSRHLPAMAAMMREKLKQNHRCLYLNSPPMVAGLRSSLWASGVDVDAEMKRGAMVLTSRRTHLVDGRFNPDHLIHLLEAAFNDALRDGFAGLWATGDMTWEMGDNPDFTKLVEYECRLEEFIRKHPEMGGICQYHADTLPRTTLRQGLLVHPSIYVNETLQLINPDYTRPEHFTPALLQNPELDAKINRLMHPLGSD
jgi:hypothetical protein